MGLFTSRRNEQVRIAAHDNSSADTVIQHGNLEYTTDKGGNGAGITTQEASGAPVETTSPLGYNVNWFTIIFLNIGQMIGTGVFSTPGGILRNVKSVGLAMLYWPIGLIIAISGFVTFLELSSYFPSRSGKEVVYLEQAYPRPRYFFPTAFAMLNVLLAFSSSNAVTLSNYLFRIVGRPATEWESKGVAIAGYTVAVVFCIASNKWSLQFSNWVGVVKILTLFFISITGLVVLGGNVKSIEDPRANFRGDAFEGTTDNAQQLVSALVRINFAYEGYQNSFNLINEIKNPIKTIHWAGSLSLAIVGILYILCNVAYFAAIPKEAILTSQTLTAALFFEAVFGKSAARGLNFLILVSAFGNLVSNLIGASRIIREIGRQGVLPYPAFWSSVKPFGTPLGPYALKWVFTVVMIVGPPRGDAFDFAVDLKSYPDAVFAFAVGIGLYVIRRQRKRINAERPEFKAWDVAIIFYILVQIFLLAMPWVPPPGGRNGGNVSFWYATYCVTGIGILLACALYYWVWIYALPKAGKYTIRQEVLYLEDGAQAHRLVRVKNEVLAEWDATHDAKGKIIGPRTNNATGVEESSSDDGELRERKDNKNIDTTQYGTKEV